MRLVDQPRDGTTQEEPQAARVESDTRFGVIVFGQRDARVRWLREGDSIVVGRAFPADLMLEDQALSRQHARLSAEREALLLTDLGSRNGVWLRGSRVVEARLRAGDSVQLGSVTLLVRDPQAANVASFDELMSDVGSFIANGGARRSLALVLLRCTDPQRAQVLSKLGTKRTAPRSTARACSRSSSRTWTRREPARGWPSCRRRCAWASRSIPRSRPGRMRCWLPRALRSTAPARVPR